MRFSVEICTCAGVSYLCDDSSSDATVVVLHQFAQVAYCNGSMPVFFHAQTDVATTIGTAPASR